MRNRTTDEARVAASQESAAGAPQPSQATPQEPTVLPVDEHHGMGGSYVIENGVRRRADEPAA